MTPRHRTCLGCKSSDQSSLKPPRSTWILSTRHMLNTINQKEMEIPMCGCITCFSSSPSRIPPVSRQRRTSAQDGVRPRRSLTAVNGPCRFFRRLLLLSIWPPLSGPGPDHPDPRGSPAQTPVSSESPLPAPGRRCSSASLPQTIAAARAAAAAQRRLFTLLGCLAAARALPGLRRPCGPCAAPARRRPPPFGRRVPGSDGVAPGSTGAARARRRSPRSTASPRLDGVAPLLRRRAPRSTRPRLGTALLLARRCCPWLDGAARPGWRPPLA